MTYGKILGNISNIENLKTYINKNGLASSARYFAGIFPPSGVSSDVVEIRNLGIMCQSISLPGRAFNTTNHIIYGTTVKMPFGVLYNDLSITFNCSDTMIERDFFDKWHSYISDQTTNYFNYYDNYKGSVVVGKLGVDNDITYISQAEEAFPISIEEQTMSYDNEAPLKLTVHFAYRRWRPKYDW